MATAPSVVPTSACDTLGTERREQQGTQSTPGHRRSSLYSTRDTNGPEFEVPPERMDLMRHHAADARTDRRWLPWSDATAEDVRAAYSAAGPVAAPAVVLADLEALACGKITGLLPDIACPVLGITGTADRYLDKILVARMAPASAGPLPPRVTGVTCLM